MLHSLEKIGEWNRAYTEILTKQNHEKSQNVYLKLKRKSRDRKGSNRFVITSSFEARNLNVQLHFCPSIPESTCNNTSRHRHNHILRLFSSLCFRASKVKFPDSCPNSINKQTNKQTKKIRHDVITGLFIFLSLRVHVINNVDQHQHTHTVDYSCYNVIGKTH